MPQFVCGGTIIGVASGNQLKTGQHASAYSFVSNLSLCGQPSMDVFCGYAISLTPCSFLIVIAQPLVRRTTMALLTFYNSIVILTDLFLWDILSLLSETLVRTPRVRVNHPPCNCCIYCGDSCCIGLRFVLQTRPSQFSLIYSFCSLVWDFASGSLQIPSHDGHPFH